MTDEQPRQTIKSKLAKGSAVAVLATALVGGFEGLRQTAYPDPASRGPPWTVCYGHTGPEVRRGVHESLTECKELLRKDLTKEAEFLDRCILVPTTVGQDVALLSLAYNIGGGGVCRSSVARDMNAGRYTQACNDFLKFDRAMGIVFPGLVRRRHAERRMCLGENR
ncbi:lysozyme [Silvimonas sp.]|uniref:lysozyme n=1 Tax=Silvimonas sp. TaxID=2650811 RepID=UPI00283E891C|nr:lysozyme [Silvimonas sp.]MDR3427808.1 lysozyme [Silvimonas sp.]